MDLNCPKCQSQDTQKLSLVMNQGGVAEKGAQMGMSYFHNFMLPMLSVIFGILLGIMFGLMFNGVVGLIVFAAVIYGGFALRKKLKNKNKSEFADLPAAMKQNGFRCNRCAHLFIPA